MCRHSRGGTLASELGRVQVLHKYIRGEWAEEDCTKNAKNDFMRSAGLILKSQNYVKVKVEDWVSR